MKMKVGMIENSGMNSAKNKNLERLLSLRVFCIAVVLLAQVVTWFSAKDDNSDAWAYHVYAGLSLLDGRVQQDYFPASTQSYFNPLVHVPFAYMVWAEWPDRLIASVMAFYSSMALVLLVIFFYRSLQLRQWEFAAAVLMSLSGLIIWTGIGSSVPDLFLQIPVLISLIFLFLPIDSRVRRALFYSGCFLGAALGLKLSAVIYFPSYALLLLWRWSIKQIGWRDLCGFVLGGVLGWLVCYGWWGIALYQKFDNPFFPFFNEWFKSPDFDQVAIVNHRFLSDSFGEQFWLPFKTALSDPLVYMEMRMPDLRMGGFLLAVVALLFSWLFRREKLQIALREMEFLIFLVVLIYVWTFMSGNGRYGVGIFCLLGGGILIALRAALPHKIFRTVFLLVFILQCVVDAQAFRLSESPFRYRDTKWGGTWFNIDFDKAVGKGGQLILVGTRNSYSVFSKDIGEKSAIINVNGLFSLELNAVIKRYLDEYKDNTLGMLLVSPTVINNRNLIDELYFQNFGRLGLAAGNKDDCVFVERKEYDGSVNGGFLFCPLMKSEDAISRYKQKTTDADAYFKRLESLCPNVFPPTMYAVTLSGDVKEKFYAGYEVGVYINTTGQVTAKKEWSMMIFPLGTMAEMQSLSSEEWRKTYCDPVRRSKAISKE